MELLEPSRKDELFVIIIIIPSNHNAIAYQIDPCLPA